jgi:hypothetical protein
MMLKLMMDCLVALSVKVSTLVEEMESGANGLHDFGNLFLFLNDSELCDIP